MGKPSLQTKINLSAIPVSIDAGIFIYKIINQRKKRSQLRTLYLF